MKEKWIIIMRQIGHAEIITPTKDVPMIHPKWSFVPTVNSCRSLHGKVMDLYTNPTLLCLRQR